MFGTLIGPDISEMIANRQFAELRKSLSSLQPESLAELLAEVSEQDMAVLFRLLPREKAADIFEYLPLEKQETLLHSLGLEQVAAVLDEMDPDDRTALLEELPGTVTQRLLTLLSPEERRIATQLLGYPEESIGRRMTPDYIAVRADWTVAQVLDHIRKVGHDRETLNVLYVIDERGRLLDDLRLREIILADPAALLTSIMNWQFDALRADQDQEEAVQKFQRLDRVALPVVDSTGLLVGMVTVDDVMDVAEEETTEDMQKMAAVEALDAPYLSVSFFTMIRKRVVWLAVLFLGQMLTATAMAHFADEIDQALVLALFLPLIISSGGNSGSQAATLVIRAMAIRELYLRDWWRVLMRELGAGFTLGCLLGAIALVRIALWPWREQSYGEYYVMIALTVATSLICVVTYGTLVGSALPMILRRLGVDPAVSSAPFVATLVDVTGIVIYFSIAAFILRGALL